MIPPDRIYQESKARSKEFKRFAVKLKKIPSRKLDHIVHELHHEAFKEINCLECANCCKTLGPRITDQDLVRLSKALKTKPSEVFEKYLITDEDGDMVFKEMPCPFLLENNFCSVYEHRPRACRDYPHTDRPRFSQILHHSVKDTAICPAVYHIFNELSKQNL